MEELQAMQAQDPQKHAVILGETAQIDAQFARAVQEFAARQQQVQVATQQYHEHFCKQQDLMFAAANTELVSDSAKHKQATEDALTYLRENGLADGQITWLWHTQPWFRAAGTQQALYDASQFRKIKKSIADGRLRANEQKLRTMPPVQRPGASGQVVSDDDSSLKQFNARFTESGSVRDAARLVAERRHLNRKRRA
ncbi:MAG: hypothetical protein ACR2GC_10565 [Methyloceanibacter sp.]|uniref:hypothetical protein n=1 Tax=Methyloceanibacter sp. TaxID=1965321 RepID=UPI003D9AF2EA